MRRQSVDDIENEKITSFISNLRAVNLHIEIERKNAEAEMNVYKAIIEKTKNSNAKKNEMEELKAIAKMRSLANFVEELNRIQVQLNEDIQTILGRYYNDERYVWTQYFIKNRMIKDIADEMHYSVSAIKYMINKFRREIIIYYNTPIVQKYTDLKTMSEIKDIALDEDDDGDSDDRQE